MRIVVKLFAGFRKGRFVKKEMAITRGTSILDIMEELGIEEEDAGIIFINGRHSDPSYELCEDDNLSIFPVVGGG